MNLQNSLKQFFNNFYNNRQCLTKNSSLILFGTILYVYIYIWSRDNDDVKSSQDKLKL